MVITLSIPTFYFDAYVTDIGNIELLTQLYSNKDSLVSQEDMAVVIKTCLDLLVRQHFFLICKVQFSVFETLQICFKITEQFLVISNKDALGSPEDMAVSGSENLS